MQRRCSNSGFSDIPIDVERCTLMWVFAVPHDRAAIELEIGRAWKCVWLVSIYSATQIICNCSIVARGMFKSFYGKIEPKRIRCTATRGNFRKHTIEIVVIDHDGDIAMVFCCRANHGWTADINILDGVFERAVRIGDGGFERVEIDHNQIDAIDRIR